MGWTDETYIVYRWIVETPDVYKHAVDILRHQTDDPRDLEEMVRDEVLDSLGGIRRVLLEHALGKVDFGAIIAELQKDL